MFFLVILGICAFLCGFTIWWQWSSRKYWQVKGVSYLPGWPFVGALKETVFFKKTFIEIFSNMYNDEKTKNEPISGLFFFHTAGLIIREPELIKRILVQDFNNFYDRRAAANPDTDSLGSSTIPFSKGVVWKNIRSNISPVFTGVKMKNFYSIMKEVCEVFEQKLAEDTSSGIIEFDIKDLYGLLTVDMISTCAFGVNANSLNNRESDFLKEAKKMNTFTLRQAIVISIIFFFPELAKFLKLTTFPESTNKFLRDSFNHVMKEREKSGAKRNDLIDILIEMKNNQSDIFHGDVLVAQAGIFLVAGYETSSNGCAFTMYELAKHPEIQEKVRREILEELKNHGEISYDRLNKLEYLEMVIKEAIRLYPNVPFLDRVCTPTDGESYSLEPYHSFRIPKGMPVYIPAMAIHLDPKIFPDPLTFRPERFSSDAKDSINQYMFLTFGHGPRGCIGYRIAMFQMKLAIISVLKDYRVECCERTPKVIKIPKKTFFVQSDGPINLVFKKL